MEHATPAVIVLILLFAMPVLIAIRAASRGRRYFIRSIPGVRAIEDAVGRSVELGRPISFSTALTGIGPLFAACLSVLEFVTGKCARYGSKLFVLVGDPESLIFADATVQNTYRREKRSSQFDPSNIRFLSSEQFAFASGYIGTVEREQMGACFLFGSFAAESLILAQAGYRAGAIQVAATTDTNQIPFFVTSCDYTLIGEELYAAGAYLSENPVQRGSIRGQDIAKLVLLLLIILGVAASSYKSLTGSEDENIVSKALAMTWDKALGTEVVK
jgi:hypothetical protein